MIEFNSLQNIIFDLGNVILKVDTQLSVEVFRNKGVSKADKVIANLFDKGIFHDFEMGNISADDFRSLFNQEANTFFSNLIFDEGWNAMLLYFFRDRIDLLKKLSAKYRIFMLSNTNEIHASEFEQMYANDFNGESLISLFEKVYYSHQMHKRKPHQNIYRQVIDENNLIPKETLFIDDLLENINGAQSVGLQTFHLVNGDDFIPVMRKLL